MLRQALHPEGQIAYAPGFVAGHRALMETLLRTLPLKQTYMQFDAANTPVPRLVSWHGDPGTTYSYSGSTFQPNPWTAELAQLREQLAPHGDFNSVLANYYRDGRDSVGFHADSEPELGPSSPHNVLIASISLGAKRSFVLKNRAGETLKFALGEGDLFIMSGAVQAHWVHGVPKTARPVLPRLNLTFRQLRT